MSGVVCHVDFDRLVREPATPAAHSNSCPRSGEFMASGAPLLLVRDGDPARLAEDVAEHVVLGLERTLEQDVAYGLRMLVDIAERSLADSPFLDPTTAVQAIDRLHDCLRQLARRPFPDGLHRDDEGVVRLTVPVMSWEAYVHLAFDEIRLAGAGSPQVARRLGASLVDLRECARPSASPFSTSRSPCSKTEVRRVVPEAELAFSLVPDRQGIGVRSGEPCASWREAADGQVTKRTGRDAAPAARAGSYRAAVACVASWKISVATSVRTSNPLVEATTERIMICSTARQNSTSAASCTSKRTSRSRWWASIVVSVRSTGVSVPSRKHTIASGPA